MYFCDYLLEGVLCQIGQGKQKYSLQYVLEEGTRHECDESGDDVSEVNSDESCIDSEAEGGDVALDK